APHVTSADVWEEVHRRTGLPIVADFYTQLYDPPKVTVEKAALLEGLCRVGDEMGVRWKKDGGFLLARSTAYCWTKLKEVPNRDLGQAALRPDGFAFADLAPARQQEVLKLMEQDGLVPPYDYGRARYRVEYVPAGWYVQVHRPWSQDGLIRREVPGARRPPVA